jgi:hypothetical protein
MKQSKVSGLLQLKRKQYMAAEATLRHLSQVEEEYPLALICSARIMLAYLYAETSRPNEALATFTPYLRKSEQHNAPSLYKGP